MQVFKSEEICQTEVQEQEIQMEGEEGPPPLPESLPPPLPTSSQQPPEDSMAVNVCTLDTIRYGDYYF